MPFQIGYYSDPNSVKTVYTAGEPKANLNKPNKAKKSSIHPIVVPLPPVQPTKQNKILSNENTSKKKKDYHARLSDIVNDLDSFTKNYQQKHGITTTVTKPKFTAQAIEMFVGNLKSRYPSKINFYEDRLTYIFFHPVDNNQITMIMFYKDMSDFNVETIKKLFSFRIPHDLCHFKNEYIGTDPTSQLSIKFENERAVKYIDKNIIPILKSIRY